MLFKFFKPNIEKLKEKRDVRGLIKALDHKDYMIRKKAIEALGELKANEAIEHLIRVLKMDENAEVRKEAVRVLGIVGDESVIPPLVEALKDESFDVKIEAINSLKRIGYKKITDLPFLISKYLKVPKDDAFKIFEEIKLGKLDILRKLFR